MAVIYDSSGRAAEYARLALTLFSTCPHACEYCYVPDVRRMKAVDFHEPARPRKNIIHLIENDCKRLVGDTRKILLSFMCDPYPPYDQEDITRQALLVLEKYNMNVTVLTKGGSRAMRDFDILERNCWGFGTSLCFQDDKKRLQWEPRAASVVDRMLTIAAAKKRGIPTWLSLEPVLNADEALATIIATKDTVDHYKVGKLNARTPELKEIEEGINWTLFLRHAEALLDEFGKDYMIKHDLEACR